MRQGGLTARLNGAGQQMAGKRGGTMNHTLKQSVPGPLARIGRRVAAIVAECNYAQARLISLQDTPAHS